MAQEHIDRFQQLYRDNIKREGADALFEWLKTSDFFTAPASTRFHGSYEGGLLEHSLNVYDCLRWEIEWADLADKYSPETIAVVSLLHDACKIDFYTKEPRNQKTYDFIGGK